MSVIMVLAGILLVAAVLLQPGKGAGLSGFGGAGAQLSTMFGARRTADFLQKFTIGLALGILALALITNKFFLSVPANALGGDERTPVTQGAPKPTPQAPPQMAPQQSPAQPQQGQPAGN